MLDLNLNVLSADSTHHHRNTIGGEDHVDESSAMVYSVSDKATQGSATQMDESGTSNSSVVNADASSIGAGDDESCSGRASSEMFTFSFDILKVGGGEEDGEAAVTKELFPVGGEAVEFKHWAAQPPSSSTVRRNWIELGLVDQAGVGEIRMDQNLPPTQPQQPQPPKKSRRGPRSRSSQYRGVTFYRRTGRWESHIWLVIFPFFFTMNYGLDGREF